MDTPYRTDGVRTREASGRLGFALGQILALGGEALRLLLDVGLPLLLGVIFFLCVTPAAIILRACGRDLLRLKRDPAARSYWVPRDPPGRGDGMTRQF